MRQLEGKVAIVTGASRGIGAGAAFVLAKAGAAVMLVARDGKRASQVADEISANGDRAMASACDVADYGSVRTMVADTERQLGRIDILVNNAGAIEPIGAIVQSDPAAWRRSIEVNLVGAYHVARAVLPRMLEAGTGTVINISSGAAHRPLEGWSAYCSAKAGLAMLTDAIALEYADAGVRAFGLAPGVVDTDMQATIRASGINRISQIRQIDLAPVGHPAAAIL
jgi:3-oxoacyl-[acyl-carrier protein] reductase